MLGSIQATSLTKDRVIEARSIDMGRNTANDQRYEYMFTAVLDMYLEAHMHTRTHTKWEEVIGYIYIYAENATKMHGMEQ